MDFAAVLTRLKDFFEQRQLRYAMAGAFALHAHGVTRATGDLDLVVEERGKEELRQFLKAAGYDELYVSEGFSNHLHHDARLGRLDFIYLEAHTADLLFPQARRMPVLDAPVPRAQHLAAMKVLAIKNDPSRTFQDLADIQALLRLPGVDRPRSRGISNGMGSGGSSRNSKAIELRVTAADVAALRQAREQRRVSPEEYARLLAQLPVSLASLRSRNPSRGERFRL